MITIKTKVIFVDSKKRSLILAKFKFIENLDLQYKTLIQLSNENEVSSRDGGREATLINNENNGLMTPMQTV